VFAAGALQLSSVAYMNASAYAPFDAELLTLGEPLAEFNQRPAGAGRGEHYLFGFGGDTSNLAVAAARHGARVAYLSRVGADHFGRRFLDLWAQEGVDCSGVTSDPLAATGAYFISHGAGGHEFSYLRTGSAASLLRPEDLPLDRIRRAKFVHSSAITQAISESAHDSVLVMFDVARAAGVRVAYDPNLRLRLWPLARARAVIMATLPSADVFLPSLEDARVLSGREAPDDVMAWCREHGARQVALKLGAGGVLGCDGSHTRALSGHRVEARDATGAGDCFGGALLARLCAGEDWWAALSYANAAAALSTTGWGAVAPIPRPVDVRALLG
jgi:2-dehydro-3-deoxygluconokinase